MNDVSEGPREFAALLEYLRDNRNIDLTGYKTPSLLRRFRKRMHEIGVETYGAYTDYLQVYPEEFSHLLNTVLINVTSFFRDPQAWEFLRDEIIPRILAGKGPDGEIRVWSAGCASGEEACTLAILLTEVLGFEQFRSRVKIYATDVDKDALHLARQASYAVGGVQKVPPALLEKYFERQGARCVLRSELRRSVIFGRHDLVVDAPISHIDLLSCRNTLMYFNSETQARIIARLHFALNDGGVLFLGKAEMLVNHSDLFKPKELKWRVFEKIADANARDQRTLAREHLLPYGQVSTRATVRDASFEKSPVAQVVLDGPGFLVLVNEEARNLFKLSPADVGRPFQDLPLSYRPIELRSHIENVISAQRAVNVEGIEWSPPGRETRFLDAKITPLIGSRGEMLGVNVAFTDRTAIQMLQKDIQRHREELETAYEELQSTNEELETTNEELQSTNEELETTNEELQATNEELETMNEELQSTNDEQQTVNDQLQHHHRAELAHALRVSTIGEVAAGLAHELNQPLAAITNYAKGCALRLRADRSDVSELHEVMDHIAAHAARAANIVRHLRNFISKDQIAPKTGDVNAIVQEAARLVEPESSRRGIALELVLGSALGPITGDLIQIEQVVLSLAMNAVEALDRQDIDQRVITIETSSSSDSDVRVTVSDTGAGIPPADSDKIYDAFFTTKPGGLGLGLSISRSIVEAHGGRLWRTPNDGRGTSFHFTLPLADNGRNHAE